MTKSELQACCTLYAQHFAAAKASDEAGDFQAALKHAMEAAPLIDGVLRYHKRFEERIFASLGAIDLITHRAPLLLDISTLRRLEAVLHEHRQVEKLLEEDPKEKIADARTRLWQNHRLWSALDANLQITERELDRALSDRPFVWRTVVDHWKQMGVVRQAADQISLYTRMGQVVEAKCPSCGSVTTAPKSMLLDAVRCDQCASIVSFVILKNEA